MTDDKYSGDRQKRLPPMAGGRTCLAILSVLNQLHTLSNRLDLADRSPRWRIAIQREPVIVERPSNELAHPFDKPVGPTIPDLLQHENRLSQERRRPGRNTSTAEQPRVREQIDECVAAG